jgi:hypothetical protein
MVDPFLGPRDPVEQVANDVMREFKLATDPPAALYRQDGNGYALIVPCWSGARLLTVPAANEADFLYHGNDGSDGQRILEFISATAEEARADYFKLPLLSQSQAAFLQEKLSKKLPNWSWSISISAVTPLAVEMFQENKSLLRAMLRIERAGINLAVSKSFDEREMHEFHCRRWGAGNRSKSFFSMLNQLLTTGCAEMITARTSDGALNAAQLDIMGSVVRHAYYAISDTDRTSGVGTAVLGLSWYRYVNSGTQKIYSFGRGTERYKYQYANCRRELFELRGFYTPV